MTGRRLYDHFCDALVNETSDWQRRERGAVGAIDLRPKAWPILTIEERRIWNALARRVTPKAKTVRAVVLAAASAEKKIRAIKEIRSVTGWGVLESKQATENVIAGTPLKLPIPKGHTAKSLIAEMAHWTVIA